MKITFIQTGGTIDKDYPQITKGWAFEIHDPAFDRVIEKLNPSFEFDTISAMKDLGIDLKEERKKNQ